MRLPFFLLVIATGLLFGCSGNAAITRNNGIRNIDATKAMEMMETEKARPVLLDVRASVEFSEGHIAGALNLDVNSPSFAAGLENLDREKTYIVYCRSGSRSARAYSIMEKAGFKDVYNLFGGFVDWQKSGFPVER